MKLFLIGFMGSGKSLIGKKLAEALGMEFLDLDDAIVNQVGMDIPAIFEKKGEAFFRQRESELLKKTASLSNTVVATGGGAPCFHNNMEWMGKEGITVFLFAPSELLAKRLKGEKEQRPLLAGKPDEELVAFIDKQMGERMKYYEMAQFKCCTDGPPEEVVRCLASYFQHFL